MTTIERLKADLAAIPGHWRVLCWSGWDQPYPPAADFREYLFHASELLAALNGEELPPDAPPITRRVTVIPVKLNVRSGPGTTHSIVGTLFAGDVVEVFDIGRDGWLQLTPATPERWIFAELTKAA